VAAAIDKAVGIQPDVVVGDRGEFTVWVNGKQVAHKQLADEEMVKSVQAAVR
jgi:hypothetical protein